MWSKFLSYSFYESPSPPSNSPPSPPRREKCSALIWETWRQQGLSVLNSLFDVDLGFIQHQLLKKDCVQRNESLKKVRFFHFGQGLHFGSKISIVFEDLLRKSVFFRTEVKPYSGPPKNSPWVLLRLLEAPGTCRASLRFEKTLNFSITPRNLSIFDRSFSNWSEALVTGWGPFGISMLDLDSKSNTLFCLKKDFWRLSHSILTSKEIKQTSNEHVPLGHIDMPQVCWASLTSNRPGERLCLWRVIGGTFRVSVRSPKDSR